MTVDLPGGLRLILAGAPTAWTWGLAALALIGLVWAFSRQELRLVGGRAARASMALRMLAALLLAAALFEPVLERTTRETRPGRVIVAVDVSASMETIDRRRPDAERQALARTLGQIDPATIPRREIARRLLDGPLAPLAREHTVEFESFALRTRPASPDAFARPLPPDDPERLATDWSGVLADALADHPSSPPADALVLLTDGRRNLPEGDLPARLAGRKIPVYPVLVGSTIPPLDVAVAALRAPEVAFRGDVATVEVVVKADGLAPGRELKVTLETQGGKPLSQVIVTPSDRSRPVATFRLPLGTLGRVPLTARVQPQAGDARSDNDARSTAIQVVDDKARVLLIDGEPRWEFRYLRNALTRDPHVRLDAVVFRQPSLPDPDPAATRSVDAAEFPAPAPSPDLADPLGEYDLIILGDAAPSDLSPEAWSRLDRYVSERGGTLAFSAGPRSWPPLLADPTARSLIPVLDPSPVPVDPAAVDPTHPSLPSGVALHPSPAALADPLSWPMLQLDARGGAAWGTLPRLPWVVAGRPKPAAAVLASAGEGPEAGGRAAIAAQPYGLGKVLWVGTDGTWRWRHRAGDAYHHRFWGQVVRWASAGRLASGSSLARFGPTRSRLPEGDAPSIQARFAEGTAGLTPDLLVAARIFRADDPSRTRAVAIAPLHPLPGRPRVYQGEATPLPPGSYVIRLEAPTLTAEGPPLEAPLDVNPREFGELIDLAADPAPPEQLARATGGRVFLDHEAAALPGSIRPRVHTLTRRVSTPLWDGPAALLTIFAILTAGWALRRRSGLS
ncbi:hypothetical protein EP7_005473 [Isosphaeraceae bacterium EP7]